MTKTEEILEPKKHIVSFRGYGVDWEGPPIISTGFFSQHYSMSKKK